MSPNDQDGEDAVEAARAQLLKHWVKPSPPPGERGGCWIYSFRLMKRLCLVEPQPKNLEYVGFHQGIKEGVDMGVHFAVQDATTVYDQALRITSVPEATRFDKSEYYKHMVPKHTKLFTLNPAQFAVFVQVTLVLQQLTSPTPITLGVALGAMCRVSKLWDKGRRRESVQAREVRIVETVTGVSVKRIN